MSKQLSGKVVLITGAAGGIGAAMANAYADAGATVIAGYNSSAERASALCASLSGPGHRAVYAPVLDSGALGSLANRVSVDFGTLDILVNNAGVTKVVPHDDLDALKDADIDTIFTTNVRGSFACVRAFRSLLAASGDGLVINISSIAGTTAIGSSIAYCASKAAIDSMTKSLARALAPHIRVISLAPGWVDGEYAQRVDPGYLQQQVDKTPLGRIARAEDVAAAAIGLSTTLRFTTGCIIPVDGGRPLT